MKLLALILLSCSLAFSQSVITGSGISTAYAGYQLPNAPTTPLSNAVAWPDTGAPYFYYPHPAYNTPFFDPQTHERSVFITDENNIPCSWSGSESLSSDSYFQNISEDESYISINRGPDNASGVAVIPFNKTTFQAGTPECISGVVGTSMAFNPATSHTLYVISTTNTYEVESCVAGSTCGSSLTSVVDLSDPTVCPGQPGPAGGSGLATNTQGEISFSQDGDLLGYWGGPVSGSAGGQNNATMAWAYSFTRGCMWIDFTAGVIYAAAGWGLPLNAGGGTYSTSSAFSNTYWTNGTSHSLHRAVVSSDSGLNSGDIPLVLASNQNYSGGYIGVFLPIGSSWPTNQTDTCDTSALCQDHYVMSHGGVVTAISGDTQCHNNGPVAWRQFTTSGGYGSLNPWDDNFSDLANTICPGSIQANSGNHASFATQSTYFLSNSYGTFASRTSPWTEEINGVSINASAQNVWRFGDNNVRSTLGCFSQSVSSNGSTMTITCVGTTPHSFTGSTAGELINCANPSFNTTFSTETVVSATEITFSTAIGSGSSAYCEMYATASTQPFYGTGLMQQSPHFSFAVFNENWRLSMPADTTGNLCGTKECPQVHIRVLETK